MTPEERKQYIFNLANTARDWWEVSRADRAAATEVRARMLANGMQPAVEIPPMPEGFEEEMREFKVLLSASGVELRIHAARARLNEDRLIFEDQAGNVISEMVRGYFIGYVEVESLITT